MVSKRKLRNEANTKYKLFLNASENTILDLSDDGLKEFAKNHIGYRTDKGLDLVCRVNGKIVLAEAKFLTDFGGHQNAQFNDAINLVKTKIPNQDIVKIAILDGVLFIKPAKASGEIKCTNRY